MQPFNSRWVVSDWDTSASDMRWCCVLSRYTRKLFFSHERIRVYVGCLIENGEDIQIHCGIRIESLASLEWRQCNKIRLFCMQIHIPAIKLIVDRMLCDLCVCVFKSVYCKIRDQCLISAGFFSRYYLMLNWHARLMIVNSAIVLLIANQVIVEWSTERKTKRQGALDNVETSVYILNVYSGNEWKYRWKTFSLVSHIKGFAEDYFNHISDQMNGYVEPWLTCVSRLMYLFGH